MGEIFESLDLITESDVEQKFILPLLTNQKPIGLGYDFTDFRTKENIRKIMIDKGQCSKIYYPDYIIILYGQPVLIIEAKKPGEDLINALREARLYAHEINSSYQSGINPCTRLIISNGITTIAAFWDSDEPNLELNLRDINSSSPIFYDFLQFASKDSLIKHAEEIAKKVKGRSRFFKPVHLLGGRTTRSGSIGENSFGVNLALEYKYLFNPETEQERRQIVQNAYVKSKKRESHVQPIDRIIRRIATPANSTGRQINDSSSPSEILETLSEPWKYVHELCLLIGSVGSGKSTFVDYLKEVALDKSLKAKTIWVTLNLNNAPIAKDIIYNWVVDKIIQQLQNMIPDFDIDNINCMKKIFATQLARFEKGPISIFPKDSERYKELLYNYLSDLTKNRHEMLAAITQYLRKSYSKLLVVVFDNCDKRDRDSQLLMFEVANWLKSQFHCLVFLPLRETTFDQYKHEPPLDTVISDLVFRIDAPLLDKVIYERFRYIIRENMTNKNNFYYFLSNGMKVECKRKDVESYLKSILSSLFQNNHSKRLITGLAGRNIRKGIEIFLDFCKSGYISEDDIYKIRISDGNYQIPAHIVTLIILKGRRLFYDDAHSRVKNLFHSDKDDITPDPFVRVSILRWLYDHISVIGPSGIRGYHKVKSIVHDLKSIGHTEERIISEIHDLMAAECIISESQCYQLDDLDEMVTITPAGIVHLDLLNDLNYLSAVSEDTWFRNESIAQKIADNLTGKGSHPIISKQIVIDNSINLINYLEDYRMNYMANPEVYLDDSQIISYFDYSSLFKYVRGVAQNDREYIDYEQIVNQYAPGTILDAQVVSIQKYGLFVEFGLNGVGFICLNHLKPATILDFELGDWIKIQIINFNYQHKKFDVRFVGLC